MGDPRPNLQVERSKVKVSRPINAKTEYAPYLLKQETDKLQNWYMDGYDDAHYQHVR